jgi:hypothetical protein
MAPLAEKISAWLNRGARVVLVCRTEQQAGRLREILRNYEVEVNHVAGSLERSSLREGAFSSAWAVFPRGFHGRRRI